MILRCDEIEPGLTFRQLRKANLRRLPEFRDRAGRLCHRGTIEEDGWTPEQWFLAAMGELGEAANKLKKVYRGDHAMVDMLPDIADELADVVIYLDLLAAKLGIELGQAVVVKFNRVSERVRSGVRLDAPY